MPFEETKKILLTKDSRIISEVMILAKQGTEMVVIEDTNELEAETSASEALYGFCAWLTTQDEETIMSAHHDSAVIADKIKLFCEVNKLSEPKEGWGKKITHPPKAVLNI